ESAAQSRSSGDMGGDGAAGDGLPSDSAHPAIEPEPKRRWSKRLDVGNPDIENKPRSDDESAASTCLYVYGIVGGAVPDHALPAFGIEPHNPPYLLRCGAV